MCQSDQSRKKVEPTCQPTKPATQALGDGVVIVTAPSKIPGWYQMVEVIEKLTQKRPKQG